MNFASKTYIVIIVVIVSVSVSVSVSVIATATAVTVAIAVAAAVAVIVIVFQLTRPLTWFHLPAVHFAGLGQGPRLHSRLTGGRSEEGQLLICIMTSCRRPLLSTNCLHSTFRIWIPLPHDLEHFFHGSGVLQLGTKQQKNTDV